MGRISEGDAVHKYTQLVRDALTHWQPMKCLEFTSGTFVTGGRLLLTSNHVCCNVGEYSVNACYCNFRIQRCLAAESRECLNAELPVCCHSGMDCHVGGLNNCPNDIYGPGAVNRLQLISPV